MTGVAICLSGGGMRSAAFSLGVVQSLQERRGLLWGPEAAALLVAVSGGSYTAAGFSLTAMGIDHTDDQPPLGPQSPEFEWIGANSAYLFGGGLAKSIFRLLHRFVLPGLVNVVALFSLFAWTGLIVADLAYFLTEGVSRAGWSIFPTTPAGVIVGASLCLISASAGLRFFYEEGGRRWLGVALLLIGALATPALIGAMKLFSYTSEPSSWLDWTPWWLALALVALIVSLSVLGPSIPFQPLRRALSGGAVALSSAIPRLIGAVLLSLLAVWWYDRIVVEIDSPSALFAIAFVLIIVGLPLIGLVAGRMSLHSAYRDLLAGTFSVAREERSAVRVPSSFPLSVITGSNGQHWPRLVISATANVRAERNGIVARHHPFVFSHDACGIPGIPGATMPTSKLELAKATGGEVQVSLMNAVASTGAALSPSMGRFTRGSLRPFLAALNLRLGRWIANPLSPTMRSRVGNLETRQWTHRARMGRALDELVQDVYGLHSRHRASVYVSDGGHYDNLGLLTALLARPMEVWCIDGSADKKGLAGELKRVLEMVATEAPGVRDVSIDDIDRFRSEDGYHRSTSGTGTITYSDGAIATLRIIKLGLTTTSAPNLIAYRAEDRRFPYQGTFNQHFSPRRFGMYRLMGYDNTNQALQLLPSE